MAGYSSLIGGFMSNWVMRPWRQMFNFRGRAMRREYWLFLVQLFVAYFLAMILLGALLGLVSALSPGLLDVESDLTIGLIVYGVMLLGLIPYLSASVRRLHDHDKTGWLFLLSFIPLIGWIFFFIMMLTPGTAGENSYGPDPRDGDAASAEDMASVFS